MGRTPMRTVLQAAAFSLLLAASIASAQTLPLANANIYLFAGNYLYGNRGDGGPADGAYLMGPAGVAVDAAGNVYISDAVAEVIREVIGATGIISTVAGNGTQGFAGDGGPATSAEFFDPYGLTADSQGKSLYRGYGK